MVSAEFVKRFTSVVRAPGPDLATAALMVARLEYPRLDASRYLDQLDQMGAAARTRVGAVSAGEDPVRHIHALNAYLFEEQGFAGNQRHYEDPRNSFLNEVLDRRTGIPITLALVYMEVARRAGIVLEGVNFPGHFLLRLRQWTPGRAPGTELIVDPFNGGAILSMLDCRRLLRKQGQHLATVEPLPLVGASKLQILIRMLVNLKRIYVMMRSFPQGLEVTELLLALNPSAMAELRDRGFLAYHLKDFSAALRDLEAYLRYVSRGEDERRKNKEHAEILEHVKTLRWRVASLN